MALITVHVKAHRVPEHVVRAHNVKAYTYTRKVKARKPPSRNYKPRLGETTDLGAYARRLKLAKKKR